MVVAAAAEAVAAAAPPELPRVFLDPTSTAPSGATIRVPAGGDFQAALNGAQPGDVIELAAGASYTGNFRLPYKSASGWIHIRSSAYANLPAAGTRVSPTHATSMAKVVSPNTEPAIRTDLSAHHYRFVGIEITTSHTSTIATHYNLILMGESASGAAATSLSQLPSDIVFDRCYIHGNETGNVRRGIAINAARVSVIDSHLSDFHEVGGDSQAIAGWNGAGPFQIVNNYLEAAGENVMFGGSDPSIANLVPSDIEIRDNDFNKPLSWKADDPSYAGMAWTVKNLLELKNAQRVLIDGNLFEHNWPHAQVGFSVLFTPRNQNGTAPWSVVQDVTFTNNVVRHVTSALNMQGFDDLATSQQTKRIAIRNNLFYDVGGPAWGGGGTFLQVLAGVSDLAVEHNTVLHTGNIITADASPANANFVYRDNLTRHNNYGVFGSNYGVGTPALAHYFPSAVFVKNVLAGDPANASYYPTGNFFPALDQIGFVDPTADDYRLSSSSPFKNAASDGSDVGANFAPLSRALGTSSAPAPTPTTPPSPTPTPTPDQTAPTVSIVSPANGATVAGAVLVTAAYGDDVGVAMTQFMLDNQVMGGYQPARSTYTWNTSTVANGLHVLSVKAIDAAGNSRRADVSIQVNNAPIATPTPAPTPKPRGKRK